MAWGQTWSELCYLFSAGRLIQLSHDDVAEQDQSRSGHRRSHAITQALGGSSFPVAVEPHINVDAPLGPEETLLLCSDGLSDMIANHIISSTLKGAKDPFQSVRKLAAKAFSAGAPGQRLFDRRATVGCRAIRNPNLKEASALPKGSSKALYSAQFEYGPEYGRTNPGSEKSLFY